MNKGIGGTVGTGVEKSVFVIRFFAGVQCINNRTVEADNVNHAIGMVLMNTVERFDDGLTKVDAALARHVYNGTATETERRAVYDVKYIDTFTVEINHRTYSTKWWDM